MVDNRNAVVDGVPNGARGGFGLCRSWGRMEMCGAVRRTLVLGTIRRERQLRGGWEGELSLRHDAVLSVLRQPEAITPMVNREKKYEKTQSCSSQGGGITAQATAEKSCAQSRGETLVLDCCRQDGSLDHQASVVRKGSHRPLSLIQLFSSEVVSDD